ncbi:hypothetical protein PsorP6_014733 [Peronosclerospora sorghi]|uniref:Uncharacterized protein n=1 Tax=Peronosclerospora sorghi TaxID=230839 RepID=A0ACC0VUH4_9STRA|nr:hypothetical protein PsorP6_014733 [Peronosclerospora sorghi]
MKPPLKFFTFSLTVWWSEARPTFVTRIPNGDNVAGVNALGHINPSGGGATNAFGKDFGAAGHEWTMELCQADSDGDGASNGEELGDPCCTWTSSAGFDRTSSSGPTHPGVANSFTASQLAAITCSRETELDAVASSGSSSSTSSASGSLALTSSQTSSMSFDDVVTPTENAPRVSHGPILDQDKPSGSVTSDATHLKTFVAAKVYCLILAFALLQLIV